MTQAATDTRTDAPIVKTLDQTAVFLPFRFIQKGQDDPTVRIVYGCVSDTGVDVDMQRCDGAWLRKALGEWFTWGNVREMHRPNAVGKALQLMEQGPDQWFVEARIVDEQAVRKVDEGIYQGFSIGILHPKVAVDPTAPAGRIIGGTIVEVSLVDRPANPAAKIARVDKWTLADLVKNTFADGSPIVEGETPLALARAAAEAEGLQVVRDHLGKVAGAEGADIAKSLNLAELDDAHCFLLAREIVRACMTRELAEAGEEPNSWHIEQMGKVIDLLTGLARDEAYEASGGAFDAIVAQVRAELAGAEPTPAAVLMAATSHLSKIGARHSAADRALIEKCHDMVASLVTKGALCKGFLGGLGIVLPPDDDGSDSGREGDGANMSLTDEELDKIADLLIAKQAAAASQKAAASGAEGAGERAGSGGEGDAAPSAPPTVTPDVLKAVMGEVIDEKLKPVVAKVDELYNAPATGGAQQLAPKAAPKAAGPPTAEERQAASLRAELAELEPRLHHDNPVVRSSAQRQRGEILTKLAALGEPPA